MVFSRAMALVLASACAVFGLVAAPAMAEPPPAERFVEPVDMERPSLSPDGDAVAVLVRGSTGRRELAVIELADPARLKMTIAARVEGADIYSARWVDDHRLVFEVGHENESLRELSERVVWAVDRDGRNTRLLVGRHCCFDGVHRASDGALTSDHSLLSTLADGSGDIIVLWHGEGDCFGRRERFHCEGGYSLPFRLDTHTGRVRALVSPPLPEGAMQWLVDGLGGVRGVLAEHAGEWSLYVPPASPGPWTLLSHFPVQGAPKSYDVLQIGADGRVYVTQARRTAMAEHELRVLDMKTGQPAAGALVSIEGFDFRGRLVEDAAHGVELGAHYEADAGGTAWFTAQMRAVQARVDALLPGRVNRIDPAACGCSTRMLVTSWSDRQPAEFLLFDAADGRLLPLGGTRPKIDPREMSRVDFVRIHARDGGDLPIYVTKPYGKGPWPTVVLVHGGPFVRGWTWEWDGESQFLASRGYLVVRPEFRGSSGYGDSLMVAGMRQWGMKMQDDIADATRWAAAQGLADPQRTCIAGASYGGYATLMGLVRYPDLYQCGIAAAAVSDIGLMYDLWWSDASDDARGYGMRALIGDPDKDAAQLAATSPLQQAGRITRPLLLAHGGLDRRVPAEHATRLRSALEASGRPPTWVFYQDEGHGWAKPANRADFLRREEAFLAAHIGTGASPASPESAASAAGGR